MRTHIAGYAGF